MVAAIELSRRIYQRMLTYALNSSIKKLEVPVFLSLVFLATGRVALSPLLMVLLLFANDFATMAITTDRAPSSQRPNRWAVQPLLLGALGVALPSLAVDARRLLGRAAPCSAWTRPGCRRSRS